MSRLYKDIFADIIKEQINRGEFKTKQELVVFLQNFNTAYFNNPVLIQRLKEAGVNLKDLDINKAAQEILEYYDRGKTDTSSLNLDGVSQVEIDGVDYIKHKKEDGTVELLDDSMNNDNFVKQFQDRQNASYNFQTTDGVKNKEEIIEDMKKDKEEVKLISSNNVNTRELTPEERREFAAIMKMNNADEINFVIDPVRNIYINKDNGELFYVHKNNEGRLEVRKAEEATVETIKEDVNSFDDMNNDITVTVEKSADVDFENLDDFELQYIVDNRLDSLTPEQKETLLRLIERRKERTQHQQTNEMVKEKEKVLTLNLNKPYNGFTSLLYLCITTFICGVGAVLYILAHIYL